MTWMASLIDSHRLDRVPSVIPARRPASDTSWQGVPPQMMSTVGTVCHDTVVMSPRFGMSGQRWAASLQAPALMSEVHATCAFRTAQTA